MEAAKIVVKRSLWSTGVALGSSRAGADEGERRSSADQFEHHVTSCVLKNIPPLCQTFTSYAEGCDDRSGARAPALARAADDRHEGRRDVLRGGDRVDGKAV